MLSIIIYFLLFFIFNSYSSSYFLFYFYFFFYFFLSYFFVWFIWSSSFFFFFLLSLSLILFSLSLLFYLCKIWCPLRTTIKKENKWKFNNYFHTSTSESATLIIFVNLVCLSSAVILSSHFPYDLSLYSADINVALFRQLLAGVVVLAVGAVDVILRQALAVVAEGTAHVVHSVQIH